MRKTVAEMSAAVRKFIICQHKQSTANRKMQPSKLQNRQLRYRKPEWKFRWTSTRHESKEKKYVSPAPQAGVLRHIIMA